MTVVTGYMPIDDASGALAELPGRLSGDDDAIALTMRGKPTLAVMRWDVFESIVETMEILNDSDMVASLAWGIEDARTGNLVPIEEVVARLELQDCDNDAPSDRSGDDEETKEHQSRPSMPVSDETFKLVMSAPGYLDA